MNQNFSKNKDTSGVATGFWLQAGVLLLLPKCHKVAVRVRPTRLPVTCNPTCPEETLLNSPGYRRWQTLQGPERGEVEKSWVAYSSLAVSDVLRSRKGGLVCKACQWFVWFVAGFFNFDRRDTFSSEASELLAAGTCDLTWLPEQPTVAHVDFFALPWGMARRVLRMIFGIFWTFDDPNQLRWGLETMSNSLHVIWIGQSPDGQPLKFRDNHKLLSFWNETSCSSRPEAGKWLDWVLTSQVPRPTLHQFRVADVEGPRKVRVFSDRKDPQNTLFCRQT